MARRLRSRVEPGTVQWAVRRAEWGVLGLTEADLDKPKIAVVNSSSGLAACFAHLDVVAAKVKEAIREAGGVPFEIRTAAPSDFVTSAGHRGGYILSARDLIVNDIEVAVEGALLDGMVCLASCDKTVPGHLMAAGRLNVPTIVVACGYQPSGRFRGEAIDIEELWLRAAQRAAGGAQWTDEELAEMSRQAILGPGVCPGMGTANSMHIVAEALGLALPGTTPVLAMSPRMWDAVQRAGRRIVAMVEEDLRPRDLLTPDAFANAVMAMLAVGGSLNTIKHLQAIATEAEVDVDIYRLFEEYADQVPLLAAVRPNGEYFIEDFEAAGGALAVLKQLGPLVRQEARTVDGRRWSQILPEVTVADPEVIRPLDRPFAHHPAIVLVRGSLAPETGVVKLPVHLDNRPLSFRGPAHVFNATDEAIAAVHAGAIKPGEVVVLRGLGPKGTPGMGMASNLVFALEGAGLIDQVAVVTDGQESGLSNKGLVVKEVSPEAYDGGPLALVEDGDPIFIDVNQRVVNLEVPEEELARRRERMLAHWPSGERGWLAIYRKLAKPLGKGAVLVD
ncbi:MAG: dihydroxy-acid dehydratase [Firmicutes bacterium]|nr:dihydroxy-acid dehydratase [Alicyclobacillaceae bacterium]MCL6496905.1 dihydroxy-acid dehydratase [Bacillota bacterium]